MTLFLVSSKGSRFEERPFSDIQDALEYCQENSCSLYEKDEDEVNLLWSWKWDSVTKRHAWIALREQAGMKTTRKHLPLCLKQGTKGKCFQPK